MINEFWGLMFLLVIFSIITIYIIKGIEKRESIKKSNKTPKEISNDFPCKECLVLACCSKLCDKVEKDEQKLLELMRKHGGCPDCGSEEFYEGPSGGLCTNFMCAGCRHKFNISPVSVERI